MRTKHTINGDQQNGWYCYQCDFFTRDVALAAEHDGSFEAEPAPAVTPDDPDCLGYPLCDGEPNHESFCPSVAPAPQTEKEPR